MEQMVNFHHQNPFPDWLNGEIVGVAFGIQVFAIIIVVLHLLRFVTKIEPRKVALAEWVYVGMPLAIFGLFLLSCMIPLLEVFGKLFLPLCLLVIGGGIPVILWRIAEIIGKMLKKKPISATLEEFVCLMAGNALIIGVIDVFYELSNIPI